MTILMEQHEQPRGMKTNGIGQRVDWLNRTRSLANDPEMRRIAALDASRERRRIAVLRYAEHFERPAFAGDDRSTR